MLENTGGYYLSQTNEIIDDRVSVVYCDFPMNWNKRAERDEVLQYCAGLQTFLLDNLYEEATAVKSRLPRAIVLRESPVISATCVMPP
ncbi:MAG: hypothetical protein H0T92_11995 [Pyrinomonadaceae bacterium]|nr:hypothetical protein [Pyrinomonadaceae bacterium]